VRPGRSKDHGASSRRALAGAVAAVLLALAGVPAARAGFWGRDTLSSTWTDKPVKVDGDDQEWPESGSFEDGGMGIQAMNDASNLWLKATSSTREGRAQLIGLAKQDVAIWFYDADGKTRRWGLRVPFSRMAPPDEDELRYGPVVADASSGVRPEVMQVASVAGSTETFVSTAPFSGDMEFRLGFSGHRPVWEIRIPRSRLTRTAKDAYPFDFIITGKAAKLSAVPRAKPKEGAEGGRGGKSRPSEREPPGAPEPVDMIFSLRLAPDPATLR